MPAVEIGVRMRAAKREVAIQTDETQIKLVITLINCHFDRREKSALHLEGEQQISPCGRNDSDFLVSTLL